MLDPNTILIHHHFVARPALALAARHRPKYRPCRIARCPAFPTQPFSAAVCISMFGAVAVSVKFRVVFSELSKGFRFYLHAIGGAWQATSLPPFPQLQATFRIRRPPPP